MAYISFDKRDWLQAQHYFDEAYKVAKDCKETHIAEQCLCNSGIASGNAMMEDRQKMFKTFYKGGFGGPESIGAGAFSGVGSSIHIESWPEESEEEDEAEYGGEDILRREARKSTDEDI